MLRGAATKVKTYEQRGKRCFGEVANFQNLPCELYV